MLEFCSCGAQLPPDSLFCHKCGKPQRDVVAAEPEPESVAENVLPPPPAVPVAAEGQPPALNFHNLAALRIAFVVAPVAFLVLGFPALSVLLWIAAGFLAVFFHRRRTGVLLNVRAGARLGWITGVIMFAITTVIFTLTVVPAVANGGIAVLREQLKNRPPDPKVQEALRMLESAPGPGLATILLVSLLMLFVFITLLSMAGGALGAKFVSRNQ